jgi:hypothetical protein
MTVNDWPPIDDIPAWPDVEDLMCTYFERFGHTCTEYPDEHDEDGQPLFDNLLPIIVINRGGGGSPDGIVDVAIVQVAVTAASRAESWRVMNTGIRRAVKAAEHGCTIDGYTIVEMSEVVGPQQLPSLNPDHREVQLEFQVNVQRPR